MGQSLRIGILGGNGMLGSDLIKFFADQYPIISINRDNYASHQNEEFDVLINANGNSKRFWANQNVLEDFNLSTLSTYKSVFDFKFKKYIYISSINVYKDPSNQESTSEDGEINLSGLQPYGFHKYLSELIVQRSTPNYLILRCPIILGNSMKRGTFYDILNDQPLLVSLDSKLQLITTQAIGEIISLLLIQDLRGVIFNIGGLGTFSVSDTKHYFGKSPSISKEAKKQIYEMNVSKINSLYPLKNSTDYLSDFLKIN